MCVGGRGLEKFTVLHLQFFLLKSSATCYFCIFVLPFSPLILPFVCVFLPFFFWVLGGCFAFVAFVFTLFFILGGKNGKPPNKKAQQRQNKANNGKGKTLFSGNHHSSHSKQLQRLELDTPSNNATYTDPPQTTQWLAHQSQLVQVGLKRTA